MLLGFDHGDEDDVNQTSRRTNAVHTFTTKETKRRLSHQRTNYEERAGRGREGHTRLLKKQRGPDADLEKAHKARPTTEEWKEESRLVVEVEAALNPC